MNTYRIEVRPPVGEGQIYYKKVNALVSQDAIAQVQRANPGCDVRCCGFVENSGSVGTNHSGENSAGGLGGLIILGLLGMGLLGLIGDDKTPKKNNSFNVDIPQVESTYRQQPVRQYSRPVEPVRDIFFTDSGIQEEAIDDLGQDWDN